MLQSNSRIRYHHNKQNCDNAIFVNEELSAKRSELAYKTRQVKRKKMTMDCWTFTGKVLVKNNGGLIREVISKREAHFNWPVYLYMDFYPFLKMLRTCASVDNINQQIPYQYNSKFTLSMPIWLCVIMTIVPLSLCYEYQAARPTIQILHTRVNLVYRLENQPALFLSLFFSNTTLMICSCTPSSVWGPWKHPHITSTILSISRFPGDVLSSALPVSWP